MDTNTMLSVTHVNALEVLSHVDAFYNTAWQHLLIFTTILLTVMGIIFPIVIQIIQNRTLKREEATLNDKLDRLLEQGREKLQQLMKVDMDSHKKELSALITQYEDKLKVEVEKINKLQEGNQAKLRQQLEAQISRTTGNVYHVQGLFLKNEKVYDQAARSLLTAAEYQLAADDQLNLRRALSLIADDCLPKLDKTSIQKTPRIRTDTAGLIKKLQEKNKNGQYEDVINNLQKALDEASERKNAAAQQST